MAVKLEGSTVLVTGANRGLGLVLARTFLDRGARRVYAGARDAASVTVDDERMVPVSLDVTDPAAVAAAAAQCADTNILVNNAGVMRLSPFITATDPAAARTEMETNYFGTLGMARAFAPVLRGQGGGALVNILSVASWYTMPFTASYGASKSAQWALTNGLRVELRGQNTLVVGVYPGFIDTDMTATVEAAKLAPTDVAAQVADAIEQGEEEVVTDQRGRTIRDTLPRHLHTLYPEIQRQWDAGENPWRGSADSG